ncbi:MAG: phosphatidylglycerophosphatase A, partial [Bacillota bacterium]
MREQVIEWLRSRGVELEDIARVVLEIQKPRLPEITLAECLESVERVIDKREAQFAILTGIALDVLAEQGQLPDPLRTAVREDSPLYGIDEVLALAITNLYGSVGLTAFGYLDKRKPGIIGQLNRHRDGAVHTFLDDLVAGVAAAAAARVAHRRPQAVDGVPQA